MAFLWGLALALLIPSLSEAGDLADSRLADPDAFARFADSSRTRPDGAALPAVSEAPGAPRRKAALTKPEPSEARKAAAVPAPPSLDARSAPKRALPALPSSTGLALVSTGALLLMALGRAGRGAEEEPLRGTVREVEAFLVEPAPEQDERSDPPAAPASWGAPPPSFPAVVEAPLPAPRLPWWALSNAEQEAIDRWDSSAEKADLAVPLAAWLDAHAPELRDVHVGRLKAKLRRDA